MDENEITAKEIWLSYDNNDTLEINVYDKDGNFLGKDTLKVRESDIPELFVRV